MYQQIIDLINYETGEEAQVYSIGKFTGLGWLHDSSNEPRITIKEYNNSVHIYAYLWDKDENHHHVLASIFGKSGVGKTCIRIKTLNSDKIDAIKDIVARLKAQVPSTK